MMPKQHIVLILCLLYSFIFSIKFFNYFFETKRIQREYAPLSALVAFSSIYVRVGCLRLPTFAVHFSALSFLRSSRRRLFLYCLLF